MIAIRAIQRLGYSFKGGGGEVSYTGTVFHANSLNLNPINNRHDARKAKSPLQFPEAGFSNLAPLTGLEPVTYGLTVRRSTD